MLYNFRGSCLEQNAHAQKNDNSWGNKYVYVNKYHPAKPLMAIIDHNKDEGWTLGTYLVLELVIHRLQMRDAVHDANTLPKTWYC